MKLNNLRINPVSSERLEGIFRLFFCEPRHEKSQISSLMCPAQDKPEIGVRKFAAGLRLDQQVG
jgi:hypothetical protein